MSEPHTLKGMIEALSANIVRDPLPTIVMDAGIATIENLQYLREKGFHYLCVSRTKPPFSDQV
ncbi:MAG: hypothetical protein PHT37_08840, partial [Candidatus Cloacimonetes bacterium]|nr:hypothetical protein [Candidatus Cloacimonadota bacterium]